MWPWCVCVSVPKHCDCLSQIWPCSWTRGSLSTTAPAGENSAHSCPQLIPIPPFSAPLWSSSINACHISLVFASGDRSYCLPREPMSALGKRAHLAPPLRLSAVIYLFRSPSLSPSLGSNTVPEGRDFTANAGNLICGKIRAFADTHHY